LQHKIATVKVSSGGNIMVTRYPTHPHLIGNFAPVQMECDAPDLIVREGELPAALNGVLYRNTANPMYPPLGDHHWFLSEGMIHAVFVKDGKASYRNRWVRTSQYEAQRRAGRRLVSTSLSEPSPPEGEHVRPHFAATHALYHGNKLFALDEWCGPAALDGDTLETIAADWDFNGKHKGAFTAHPKIDPQSGEMLGYGYQAAGIGTKEMSFSVVSPTGELTCHDHFQGPFCPIMHDFGITAEHVIFPFFSADISLERANRGGPLAAYDPKIGTQFGIMRRDAKVGTIRWFKGDPTYAYHTMNSFTEHKNGRTRVMLDMMKYQFVPFFPDEHGKIPQWLKGPASNGTLVRWTFDLDSNSDSYSEKVLSDLTGDFCVVDPRFVGQPYKHGYYTSQTGVTIDGGFFDTICHLNVESGERRDYFGGNGVFFVEPIFVPRAAAAPEGDGWLVTLAYDAARNLSDFIVLDTDDIRKGPIARVQLPSRVPYGFHGSWRSADS
jgi:carotenoid cleavage dioxygenase